MTDLLERLRGPIGPFIYQHDRGIALTCEAADVLEQKDRRIAELEAELDAQAAGWDDAVEKLTERWGNDAAALQQTIAELQDDRKYQEPYLRARIEELETTIAVMEGDVREGRA